MKSRTLLRMVLALAAGVVISLAVAIGCVRWGRAGPRRIVDGPAAPAIPAGMTVAIPGVGHEVSAAIDAGVGHDFEVITVTMETGDDPSLAHLVILGMGRRCTTGWPRRIVEAVLDGIPKSRVEYDSARASLWVNGGILPSWTGTLAVTRILWSGLVVDSAFFGALVWVGVGGLGLVQRAVRRRRGLCVACGYELKGNVTGVCPECGERKPA